LGSKANNLYSSGNRPPAGGFGRSGDIRTELDLIEAGFYKLKRTIVQVYFEDANNGVQTRSVLQPTTRAGTVARISVTPQANNSGAPTVFTAAIGSAPITMPTLQLSASAAAHEPVSVVPTDLNSYDPSTIIANNRTLRITSDGGGSSVMPVMVTIEIED
jgi:hypothetical protein